MKVLIIDDSKAIQLFVSGMIKRMGFECVCAGNGQEVSS